MAASSRIPGFYRRSLRERRQAIAELAGLTAEEVRLLSDPLPRETADEMAENVVGIAALPLGVALNFVVNGRERFVPMAIEEPSVIAAASNAARRVREGGGFACESDPPVMIAQIEIGEVPDLRQAMERIEASRAEILAAADAVHPRLQARGGGAVDLCVRVLDEHDGRLVVHLGVDCRDAMGANLCNTVAESLAPMLADLAGGSPGLRILSNLSDRRRVRVRATIPLATLATGNLDGAQVAHVIAEASRFAELDPYRAATHNKGIMNGVDAAALAFGQDWRALEAGAHAYAARSGRYAPLSRWRAGANDLAGELELPMAVGTVGGAVRAHPGVRVAMKVAEVRDASDLGQLLGAAGLATNLAALRALATEGIQRGHMELHRRGQGKKT
jgi:hydroxymethylglutaryl-CoA reductase